MGPLDLDLDLDLNPPPLPPPSPSSSQPFLSPPSPSTPLGTPSRGPWGQRTPQPQCTPRRKPATRSAVTPSPTRMGSGPPSSSHSPSWQVPKLRPQIGVHEKMGRGHLSSRDADAEKTLSSLFVADEMAKHPRPGWGSTLFSSAVSATVFGAAVGLTAYRIWTGGWGSIVQNDALPQEPPPDDELEDVSEPSEPLPPLPFPTSPRSHTSATPRRKYAASVGSSTSARRRYHLSPTSSAGRRRRAKRPTIAELLAVSAPMTPVSDQPLSPGSDTSGLTGMTASRSPTSQTTLDPILGSDTSDSDDETTARLAMMAHRVQGLIAEGQAALSSPVSTPRRVQTPRMSDFPQPPPRETLPPLYLYIPRPRTREGMTDERVSGWDTDTTEEPPRSSARSLGYGAPPRPASRPVSVASVGSVSGSFPRSSSVSSSSSRYQPAVPPLPWRRESFGATNRWVQKQHSPNNSISLKNEVPLMLARGSPTTSTHPRLPLSPRPDSASRIPRPGAHSRASSVASLADSPSPAVRREHERETPSRLSLERGGWNSPVPPQGLVAARTSLFTSVAERNNSNRSKIPIRRSIGSISSITAVQPSPKA